MGLEKEVMHVVIKLPFKRPADFVEPPPVVWTDEMEQHLWKYMNQKHTDWNYIAEQLGVPTPYLVRHAAFMYETQLRGIQQQLRISEAGRPSTIASPPPPPTVSTSTSSTTTHRSSRPSSQKQAARPVSSLSSSSRTQQRNSTVWKDAQEHQGDSTGPNEAPMITSSMDIAASATATAAPNSHRYHHSPHDDSMMLSAISNIVPRTTNNPDALSPHDSHSMYSNQQQLQQQPIQQEQQQEHQQSDSLVSSPSNDSTQHQQKDSDHDDTSDEDGFSKHFETMKLQEEPAFLPSKRMEGSQLLNSLRASSQYCRSPSSSPQTTSAATTTIISATPTPTLSQLQIHTSSPDTAHEEDEKSGTDDPNGKTKMVFGPNLNRVAQQTSDKESNSALNSVGSSFSDLSDYSVTQSALEDAFMSKLNNGSKMSSLAFSRKYT